MKMRKQKNRWSCLLTSFAMCLDVDEDIMEYLIGHDGSEILWPNLPEPTCRRSFHIMELIRVAWLYHHAVVPLSTTYELFPDNMETKSIIHDMPKDYMIPIMEQNQGVLTGIGPSGKRHAVAWNREVIFDPSGGVVYSKEKFPSMEMFWAVVPMRREL